jgi:acyl phosphate:glycerol-3-phosphate acyltransferase
MTAALTIPIAYLLGSIPTGVLLARYSGADPREAGSGNIGASNVTRTAGRKWGAITLLVDLAKGALPTWLAGHFFGLEWSLVAAGVAVFGHCFPVWLRFKGGKGVATAFGTFIVLAPGVGVVSALLWVTLLLFTRTPAIGSLAAAASWVVLAHVDQRPFPVLMYCLALAALIVLRHTGNVRVLLARHKARAAKRKRRRAR